MRQVYKYDEDGFYLEPIVLHEHEPLPSNCTEIAPEGGLFKAKHINGHWFESLPQSEIDQMFNQSTQPSEIELLKQENAALVKRLEEAENAIMTLMDMSLL